MKMNQKVKKRSINPSGKMDLVLRTARKLFLDKGFHAVSIPDIVKASGVSVGAIYLHFGNKEKLATAVYQQASKEFLDRLFQKLGERPLQNFCAREILADIAELIFEITEDDPEMMEYLLSIRQGYYPGALSFYNTPVFHRLEKIIDDGIASGELRPGNHSLCAAAYCGVILQAVELRLNGQLEQPLWEMAEQIFENAWASIKAA